MNNNTINLKKIISNREIASLIKGMINCCPSPISIYDSNKKCLLGDETQAISYGNPIELEESVVGWVVGDDRYAVPVLKLLIYILNRELERKQLARETLDKYREINLLHRLSGKLTANLTLIAVGEIILQEIKDIVTCSSGALFLIYPNDPDLELVGSFGNAYYRKKRIKPLGIISSVIISGNGEIVNDVFQDTRYHPQSDPDVALIAVPIKTTDQVIGLIVVSNQTSIFYKAADLKLLNIVASQVASVIANAIIYEKVSHEQQLIKNLSSLF